MGCVLPDWRDEVSGAVEFWISTVAGGSGQGKWKRIGPARAEADRGWYAVDVRGSGDLGQVDAVRLAGSSAPSDGNGHPALEVVQEGQLLRVRVAEFVDLPDAYLWQFRQPPTYLLTSLRDGLRAIGSAGLAHDLAAGRLAHRPPRLPDIAGFTAAQREAYASCFAPGVRLVWGSPGTGKTRVLSEAIGDLVAAGARVLLVSSTNIAVDNALSGVIGPRRHRRAGDLVRVGPPHLRKIADNPEVSLTHLVRATLTEVEQRRQAIQA